MPTRKSQPPVPTGQIDLHGCLPTPLTEGDRVIDRQAAVERPEDDDVDLAVVVDVTNTPAHDRTIPAAGGRTVADLNPEYPSEDRVVTIVFAPMLDVVFGDSWLPMTGGELSDAVATEHGGGKRLPTYDYPSRRLLRLCSALVTDRRSLIHMCEDERDGLRVAADGGW